MSVGGRGAYVHFMKSAEAADAEGGVLDRQYRCVGIRAPLQAGRQSSANCSSFLSMSLHSQPQSIARTGRWSLPVGPIPPRLRFAAGPLRCIRMMAGGCSRFSARSTIRRPCFWPEQGWGPLAMISCGQGAPLIAISTAATRASSHVIGPALPGSESLPFHDSAPYSGE